MKKLLYSKLFIILFSLVLCTKAYASNVKTDLAKDLIFNTEGHIYVKDPDAAKSFPIKNSEGKEVVIDKDSKTFEVLLGNKNPTDDFILENAMARNKPMNSIENLKVGKMVPGAAINADGNPFSTYLLYGANGTKSKITYKIIVSTRGDHELDFNKGLIAIVRHNGNKTLTIGEDGTVGLISIGNLGGSYGKTGNLYSVAKNIRVLGENIISYEDKASNGYIAGGVDDDNVAVQLGNDQTKYFLLEESEFTNDAGDGAYIKLVANAIGGKVIMELEDEKNIDIKGVKADYLVRNAGSINAKNKVEINNAKLTKALFASPDNYHGKININFEEGLKIVNTSFADNVAFIAGAEAPERVGEYDTAAVKIKGSYSMVGSKGEVSGENKGTFLIRNRNNIVIDAGDCGDFTVLDNEDSNGNKVQSIMLAVDEAVLKNDNRKLSVKFRGDNSDYYIGGIGLKVKTADGAYRDLVAGDINDAGGLKVTVAEANTMFRDELVAHVIKFGDGSKYGVTVDDTDITKGKIERMGGWTDPNKKGTIKLGTDDGEEGPSLDINFTGDALNLTAAGIEYTLFDTAEFDIAAGGYPNGFNVVNKRILYKGEYLNNGNIKLTGGKAENISFDVVNNTFEASIDGAAADTLKDHTNAEVVINGDETKALLNGKTFKHSVYIKDIRREYLEKDKTYKEALLINGVDGTAGGVGHNIVSFTGYSSVILDNQVMAIGNKIANKKALIYTKKNITVGNAGEITAFINNEGADVANLDGNILIGSIGNVTVLGDSIIFNGNKVSTAIETNGDVSIVSGGNIIIEGNNFDDTNVRGFSSFIYSAKEDNKIKVRAKNFKIKGLLGDFNFNNNQTKNLEVETTGNIEIDGNGKAISFFANNQGDGISYKAGDSISIKNIKSSKCVYASWKDIEIIGKSLILDDLEIDANENLFLANGGIVLKVDDFQLKNTSGKAMGGDIFTKTSSDQGFDIDIDKLTIDENVNLEGSIFYSIDGNSNVENKFIIHNADLDGKDNTEITNIIYSDDHSKTTIGEIKGRISAHNLKFRSPNPYRIGSLVELNHNSYDDKEVNINGSFIFHDSEIDTAVAGTPSPEKAVINIINRNNININLGYNGIFETYNNNGAPTILFTVADNVLKSEMMTVNVTGSDSKFAPEGIKFKKYNSTTRKYQALKADGSDINAAGGLKFVIHSDVTYEIKNNSKLEFNEIEFHKGSKLVYKLDENGGGNNGKLVGLKRGATSRVPKITGKVMIGADVDGGELKAVKATIDNVFKGFDISALKIKVIQYPNYYVEYDEVAQQLTILPEKIEIEF